MKRTKFFLLLMLAAAGTVESQAQTNYDMEQYLAASAAQPYDVTWKVSNASCTENSGWSRNSNDAAADYVTHNPEFDDELYSGLCVESWYWSPVVSANLIWQDVEGLLPGTYRLTAYVVGQVYNDASNKGQCLSGLYLFANDTRTAITSPTWQTLSVEVTLLAGETLSIGIQSDADNLNDWTGIAAVQLECIGAGEPEEIGLSENFDVHCVKGETYANVALVRSVPSDGYTTLCLPFDVGTAQASLYFSEMLQITGASAHGNDIVVTTAAVDSLQRGEVYLVKAKSDVPDVLEFAHVLVSTSGLSGKSVGNYQTVGTYRQQINLSGVYELQDDGQTFHKVADVANVKAYSGYVIVPN